MRKLKKSIQCFVLLLIIFLFSCAPKPLIHKESVIEKPGVDPFETFPGKYRLKAVEYERKEDLRKAFLAWQVVLSFLPYDNEASEKIAELEDRIRIEDEKHFQKGLDYFRNNSFQAARKEFLIALSYNQDNEQALYYLKHKLNDNSYIRYETKEGDTLRSIAKEVYNDPEMDFLIVYFNDLNKNNNLREGIMLKLPVIDSILINTQNHKKKNRVQFKTSKDGEDSDSPR